jgi:PiT family inorganic phosphate transporter
MTPDLALFILILVSGFYMAWNIGANDVANAMGTSVGSGALSLRQAIMIAAVLEFCGAFFLGSHVSETMQSGIINPEYFADEPKQLLLGMLSALIGTGVWLQIASYFGWPVSTTHSIVGAIVGFGVLIGGVDSIYWDKVLYIVSSWVISPLLGGLISYNIFQVIRTKVFYAPHPLEAAKRLMPYMVFGVFILLTLLFLFNGLDNLELEIGFIEAAGICLSTGIVAATLSKFGIDYWLKDTVATHVDEMDHTKEDFAIIEKMFAWLQILSACLMAFAHGANDVANAIGPLSAALFILETGTVALDTAVPSWALGLGGIGIVIGLATWGWRVIETIGKKITELTPTRGFAAEISAAATIMIASRLGLPISTTHTLVGAVIGVGLARGIEALNIGMTRDIVASWIITIPAGALTAVGIYMVLAAIF